MKNTALLKTMQGLAMSLLISVAAAQIFFCKSDQGINLRDVFGVC